MATLTTPPALLYVRTTLLDVAYETHGPVDGEPVILLHGFPYDPRGYDDIAPVLAERGYRVLVPYLRGYGPTRFINTQVMRSGQQAALAKDLLDFMDALAIPQATLAGFDWGGRAACIVAALWPQRVRGLVTGDGYNIQAISLNFCLTIGVRQLDWRPQTRLLDFDFLAMLHANGCGLETGLNPLADLVLTKLLLRKKRNSLCEKLRLLTSQILQFVRLSSP